MPGSTLRLIIGNWKMHGSLARNAALLNALTQGAEQLSGTLEHFSVRLPKGRARSNTGQAAEKGATDCSMRALSLSRPNSNAAEQQLHCVGGTGCLRACARRVYRRSVCGNGR